MKREMPFNQPIGGGMFPPFMGMESDSPFGRNKIPARDKEERGGFNPFESRETSPASSSPSSLNIDDLVKKIDQKIAELEEEERLEKEKMEKEQKKKEESNKKEKVINKIDDFEDEEIIDAAVEEEPKKEVINKPVEFNLDDDDDDDDEFFDDFFDN